MTKFKMTDKVLNYDYGVKVNGDQTVFSVWSPSSKSIKLYLYKTAKSIRRKIYDMSKMTDGIWTLVIDEALSGQFYTFLVDDQYEVVDPYARSANGNSTKGAIVDALKHSPVGFDDHKIPDSILPTESILYELHVKDFSMGKDSPFVNKGLYLAFTERGLTFNGEKIGVDHLVELGITHVHLLPVFDFITVNDFDPKSYNWRYDPYLFNALEGSYSSVMGLPLYETVQSLQQCGIKVL